MSERKIKGRLKKRYSVLLDLLDRLPEKPKYIPLKRVQDSKYTEFVTDDDGIFFGSNYALYIYEKWDWISTMNDNVLTQFTYNLQYKPESDEAYESLFRYETSIYDGDHPSPHINALQINPFSDSLHYPLPSGKVYRIIGRIIHYLIPEIVKINSTH